MLSAAFECWCCSFGLKCSSVVWKSEDPFRCFHFLAALGAAQVCWDNLTFSFWSFAPPPGFSTAAFQLWFISIEFCPSVSVRCLRQCSVPQVWIAWVSFYLEPFALFSFLAGSLRQPKPVKIGSQFEVQAIQWWISSSASSRWKPTSWCSLCSLRDPNFVVGLRSRCSLRGFRIQPFALSCLAVYRDRCTSLTLTPKKKFFSVCVFESPPNFVYHERTGLQRTKAIAARFYLASVYLNIFIILSRKNEKEGKKSQ